MASGGNISKSVLVVSGALAADLDTGLTVTTAAFDDNDVNVYLNGILQRSGSQGQNDIYRQGTTLKFNYALISGDFIVVQHFA